MKRKVVCLLCGYEGQAHESMTAACTEVAKKKVKAFKLLQDALFAEREGSACGEMCTPGGWRRCSGCDSRIKAALAAAAGAMA